MVKAYLAGWLTKVTVVISIDVWSGLVKLDRAGICAGSIDQNHGGDIERGLKCDSEPVNLVQL